MKWVGHVARMGERRGVYRILVERPLKIYFQEVGEGMDWSGVSQDRDGWRELVNAVISPHVP